MVFSRSSVAVIVAYRLGHQYAVLDRDRLVHDPALFRVIAHFHVALQRKILAERVSLETVVGQDASQVGMSVEHDAEQVKGLPFEPVGAGPDGGYRSDPGRLAGDITAQPEAPVMF